MTTGLLILLGLSWAYAFAQWWCHDEATRQYRWSLLGRDQHITCLKAELATRTGERDQALARLPAVLTALDACRYRGWNDYDAVVGELAPDFTKGPS